MCSTTRRDVARRWRWSNVLHDRSWCSIHCWSWRNEIHDRTWCGEQGRRWRGVRHGAAMWVAVSTGNQIPRRLPASSRLQRPYERVEMTPMCSFSATLNPDTAHLPLQRLTSTRGTTSELNVVTRCLDSGRLKPRPLFVRFVHA